ncbi:hypothetical protein JHK82_038896 [Glycine max]|uniref:Uncharacterized protein n=1 Tax=Glycine soja TaxID=3848 RepID=A0A0B2SWD1_GLYSO|nr:hypothetical protein JHK87_038867 [Glycine soja]KAG4962206.1 hypothetical protein JHK86_039074 [Glycine max]KAG4964682.1 hypothetical protein JHK85_039657 [Glycine max]KAG5109673.1 hypothetical protein JHK82_038896 [Glycine max]KAG5120962.1 hypothetical protein JHK84_039302 [Glycine max]
MDQTQNEVQHTRFPRSAPMIIVLVYEQEQNLNQKTVGTVSTPLKKIWQQHPPDKIISNFVPLPK